jgi:hypothetical protein
MTTILADQVMVEVLSEAGDEDVSDKVLTNLSLSVFIAMTLDISSMNVQGKVEETSHK